jgi:hypothetical protein
MKQIAFLLFMSFTKIEFPESNSSLALTLINLKRLNPGSLFETYGCHIIIKQESKTETINN